MTLILIGLLVLFVWSNTAGLEGFILVALVVGLIAAVPFAARRQLLRLDLRKQSLRIWRSRRPRRLGSRREDPPSEP